MAGDISQLDSTVISKWPEANLVDPITRMWFPIYSIILEVATTLVILARIWAQARKATPRFGLDDAVICAAWVFVTLFTVLCLLGTLKYGFDKHIWDVPRKLYRSAALVQWLSDGAFTLSVCLTKISVLCFYRRLDLPCRASFKRLIHVFMAFTGFYTLAILLTGTLLCRPVSAYWTIPEPSMQAGQKCAGRGIYYLIHGMMDTLATMYTIGIPFLALYNLPMSQTRRNALTAVLFVALSVLAAGIARTAYMFRLANSTNGDATWNGFNVWVCAQLESQLAIICASLPFLRAYLIPNPSVPIVLYTNSKHDSVISRVSSSLSGQIRRLPLVRTTTPRIVEISRPIPQTLEIPAWEFEAFESPRSVGSLRNASSPGLANSPAPVPPADEISYEQYVRGQFGPPAPPKDSRAF